jgi:hypothetical protein
MAHNSYKSFTYFIGLAIIIEAWYKETLLYSIFSELFISKFLPNFDEKFKKGQLQQAFSNLSILALGKISFQI